MATLASMMTTPLALQSPARRLSDSPMVSLRRRQPGAAAVVVRASSGEGSSIKVQQQQQQQQPSSMQRQSQQPQQNGSSSMQRQPQQQRGIRRQQSSLLSPLDLWDPFMPSSRTFGQMLDLMNQMMDATSPSTSTAPSISARGRSPWDVMEDEESFKMRVDMPGLSKEEVSVTIEDNRVLVIKGETSSERKEKDEWVARSSGSYESRVVIPDNVDVDKIQAELKDGVLYVRVPKRKVEPPKQISVQVS